MKKTIYTLSFCLIVCFCLAQTPNWAWGRGAGGGMYNDYGNSISADAHGNCYATGYFQTPIIIFGNDTLHGSTNYLDNLYIVKYDANGNVKWAKSAGGQNNAYGTGISTDANGNSYLTGYFGGSGIITFDTFTITAANGHDVFVAKYDSSGNVLWVKNPLTSSGPTIKISIDIDVSGNSYVTGCLDSILIMKLDNLGNMVWKKYTDTLKANNINTDANGNSYVTGTFTSNSVVVGTNTLTNTSGGAILFVVKYDSSGNVLWAKSTGGVASLYLPAISNDGLGNSYVTGYFNGTHAIFGSTTLTNAGFNDIFVVKFNSSGNIVWAKRFGGPSYDAGNSISTDTKGNSYLTGYFRSHIAFGSISLSNSGSNEIFVTKLDSSGNVLWAKGVPYIGNQPGMGNGICVDANKNVYTTGYFFNTALVFDNDTLFDNSGNFGNVFVAKLDSSTAFTGINQLAVSSQLNIYPNPTSDQFFITANTTDKLNVDLFDVNGRHVFSANVTDKSNINVTTLGNGIYTLTIKTVDRVINKKLIILR